MQNSERYKPLQNTTRDQPGARDAMEVEGPWAGEAEYTPPNGLAKALGVGVAAGLVAALLPVIITFILAPLYQDAVRLGNQLPYSTAATLLWLFVAFYVLELILGFCAGFIVGKIAVKRLLGLYAGLLVGAIAYLGSVVVNLIPGYPSHTNATTGSTAATGSVWQGLLLVVGLLLVRALIAGLLGLWGSTRATRRHPYYLAKAAAEEREAALAALEEDAEE